MQTPPSEVRADLDAALAARRELGPEYESALVDSFLARVDAQLDARIEQRVAERLAEYPREEFRGGRHSWAGSGSRLHVTSLVLAIPLTGIGLGVAHGAGTLVAWAGIVSVNLAAALGRRFDRRESERRPDRAVRSEWA
jgi:hypothetical protein